MTALTDFLRARLDEEAATARSVGPACIAWLTLCDSDGNLRYTTVAAELGEEGGQGWVADGKEIPDPAFTRIVYDPARVLREVDADRKLLDLMDRATRYRDRVFAQPPPRSISDEMRAVTQMMALEQVLKLRAAVYSDHPDYRPEWTPGDETP